MVLHEIDVISCIGVHTRVMKHQVVSGCFAHVIYILQAKKYNNMDLKRFESTIYKLAVCQNTHFLCLALNRAFLRNFKLQSNLSVW